MAALAQRETLVGNPRRWAWALIALGILLRAREFLFNRSFWLDEAYLALNIRHRSFSELLQPLDYNQGAPIGFVLTEKLLAQFLGESEYILRLLPFTSAILSLILFYTVGKRILNANALLLGLGLFSIAQPLIYYGAELKQYSSDVAIALLVYTIALVIPSRTMSFQDMALWGSLGFTVLWFSHPALFILGGVAMSMTFSAWREKDWRQFRRLACLFAVWGTSLTACYMTTLRFLRQNETLMNYWDKGFMPLPPMALAEAKWYITTFFGIFLNPVGFTLSGIGMFAFAVGVITVISKRDEIPVLLLSPILFVLLASGFRLYPFRGRMLLFLVPILFLLIGQGAERVRAKTWQLSPAIGGVLIALLFLHPTVSAVDNFVAPLSREEIRPVMSYLSERHQAGDSVYLHHSAWPAFSYYAERYGFQEDEYRRGRPADPNWRAYRQDVLNLRGQGRVWVLFSHTPQEEVRFFLDLLDRIGMRLESVQHHGSGVFLYDLRGRESTR